MDLEEQSGEERNTRKREGAPESERDAASLMYLPIPPHGLQIINSLAKGRPADAALLAAGLRPPFHLSTGNGVPATHHHDGRPLTSATTQNGPSLLPESGESALLQAHKAAFFFKLERELEKVSVATAWRYVVAKEVYSLLTADGPYISTHGSLPHDPDQHLLSAERSRDEESDALAYRQAQSDAVASRGSLVEGFRLVPSPPRRSAVL